MKTTKLEQCFSLFYGKDKLRPKFDNPLTWNDKIFATDAYTLIYVDKSEIDFEFKNEYESPNLDSIVPNPNISEIINVPDLEQYKTEDDLRKVGDDVKCSECDGYGRVEWEYERWTKTFDCPKCDGDGFEYYAKTIPTGLKTFRNIKVKIKDNYLDIFKFKKVLQVQEILGGEIELLYCESDKASLLFKVGICYIIVMKLSGVYSDAEILKLL